MTRAALFALPLLALLAGCAGYRLGSPVPEALRSVHVAAFENRTAYPMAGAIAAQQLLDALIEDGTFAPTGYDEARLRVQATITGVGTQAVSYSRNNNIEPDEYHVVLSAQLYAFDAQTGETYINGKTVRAIDSALTRNDYQTAVADTLPRVSRKLAQAILTELHGIAPREN